MNQVGYGNYQAVSLHAQAASASPVQLVLLLMNGLLDEMARARAHIEQERYEAKGKSINKCIDILTDMISSLDFELGGETVSELARLYEYCAVRLNEAGLTLDTSKVDEVVGLVTILRDAWQTVEDRHG